MEAVIEKRRYVGIDLGKREYTLAIISVKGKVTLHEGKTSPHGLQALYRLLEKTDKVALEAGNLAFIIASDIQERVGCEVRVLNAAKLPFIWDTPTKTDREDAMKLAHLVEERRDEKLPIVPLPSPKEMERRKILANYRREQRNRTRHINTLHALFVHQGITTVVRKDLAKAAKRKEVIKLLSGQEREEAEWIAKYLDLHEVRIRELRGKIEAEAKQDELMKLLQTVAGVGPIVAFAFLAHVGDGSRFDAVGQVSNFLGFVPKLDYSGTIHREGHITKRGNGFLRGLMVQAAWSLVRCKKGGALRERYRYITGKGISKKKTIVSIARRMAEMMYSMLRNRSEYEVRRWAGSKNMVAQLAAKA
jgi:transposase